MNTPSPRPDGAEGESRPPDEPQDSGQDAGDPSPFHLSEEFDEISVPKRPPTTPPPPGAPMTFEGSQAEAGSREAPAEVPVEPEPALPPVEEIEVVTVDEEPQAEPETEPEEGPAGDTVRMSLADATAAWIEDTPHSAATSPKSPDAGHGGVRLGIVLLVLLAAAVVAGILLFCG